MIYIYIGVCIYIYNDTYNIYIYIHNDIYTLLYSHLYPHKMRHSSWSPLSFSSEAEDDEPTSSVQGSYSMVLRILDAYRTDELHIIEYVISNSRFECRMYIHIIYIYDVS